MSIFSIRGLKDYLKIKEKNKTKQNKNKKQTNKNIV